MRTLSALFISAIIASSSAAAFAASPVASGNAGAVNKTMHVKHEGKQHLKAAKKLDKSTNKTTQGTNSKPTDIKVQ